MEQAEQAKEPLAEDILKDIAAVESISVISLLLDVICKTTGMGFAAVARVTDELWVACSVKDDIGFGLKAGGELQLQTTICNEIRQHRKAVIIDHVAEDKQFCDHHTPALYGFQSYISVPISRKDGRFFGTLCAIDPKPNKLNTPEIKGMFNLFADLISFHLQSAEAIKNSALELAKERSFHRELEENEEKLKVVIDASELAIWEVNLVSKVLISSGRLPELMGYRKGELPSWETLRSNLHPDDLAGRERAYAEAFKTGKLYFMARIIWPDGSIHWIETRGHVFFDEKNAPLKMIGATRDVTEEKLFSSRLEERVKERTLQLNEKNAELEKMNKELESFAYVSSHDLQEPLRKIQAFATFISQEGSLPEKVQTYFDKMQLAANRMQVLINDLLAYSRTGTDQTNYENTDLSVIIEEAKEELADEIQQTHAVIEINVHCELNVIRFQMRQLFQNLISNSLKFSLTDRVPHIKITSQITAGKETGIAKLAADTDYCCIRILDNGIGFENQYAERIFEMFQRLHGRSAYKGTGIGLAIVKKIVENHKGVITAQGELGSGARFDIYLPM